MQFPWFNENSCNSVEIVIRWKMIAEIMGNVLLKAHGLFIENELGEKPAKIWKVR